MKSCCDGIAEGSNSLRTTIVIDVVIGITRDHVDALEWFDSYYQFIVSEQRLMFQPLHLESLSMGCAPTWLTPATFRHHVH